VFHKIDGAMSTAGRLLEDMRRAARGVSQEWLQKKNVQFLTVGQKRLAGMRMPVPAVIAYVSRKESVAAADLIPEELPFAAGGGPHMKTDVVALAGTPRAFGLEAGNVILASDQSYGVCTMTFVKNGVGYALTNAHVGCDIAGGGSFCGLSLVEPVTNRVMPVGPVIWSSGLAPGQVARSDAAVARADSFPVDPYQIFGVQQPLAGTSHIVPGNTTYWFMWNGVEFNCAYPETIAHPAAIDVEGMPIEYDNFWVLHMTKGASAPGQSGALLCRTDAGNSVIGCGIVFGGSAPNLLFAFSFDEVFNQIYAALP